jgi:hypothetical protein
MNRFTVMIGAVALSSCAMGPSAGQLSPAQSVYALEGAYASALRGAVAYRSLPKCGTVGVAVCHNPEIVKRLVIADAKAHDALLGAEAVVRAHGSAEQISAAVSLARVAISDLAVLTPNF